MKRTKTKNKLFKNKPLWLKITIGTAIFTILVPIILFLTYKIVYFYEGIDRKRAYEEAKSELSALPMASPDLLGMKMKEQEFTAGAGYGSKYVGPSVRTVYDYPKNKTSDQILKEIKDELEKNNWINDFYNKDNRHIGLIYKKNSYIAHFSIENNNIIVNIKTNRSK